MPVQRRRKRLPCSGGRLRGRAILSQQLPRADVTSEAPARIDSELVDAARQPEAQGIQLRGAVRRPALRVIGLLLLSRQSGLSVDATTAYTKELPCTSGVIAAWSPCNQMAAWPHQTGRTVSRSRTFNEVVPDVPNGLQASWLGFLSRQRARLRGEPVDCAGRESRVDVQDIHRCQPESRRRRQPPVQRRFALRLDAWAVGGAASAVGSPPRLQTRPLIAHWNGRAWRTVDSPIAGAGGLSAIAAVTSHNIWAVGHQGPNEGGSPLIEHWNGSAWSVVPSPRILDGHLLGVSAVGADDVWAVGIRVGKVSYSLIEHWDGAGWKVVKSPNPGVHYNEIDSVVGISSHEAWAVGFSQSTEVSRPILVRWDGFMWSTVGNPSTGTASNLLRSVAGVSGNVWAVGQSRSADGSSVRTLVEHLDAHGWKVVASPSPTAQSWLAGVAVRGDEVWAVGVRVDGFTGRHAEAARRRRASNRRPQL